MMVRATAKDGSKFTRLPSQKLSCRWAVNSRKNAPSEKHSRRNSRSCRCGVHQSGGKSSTAHEPCSKCTLAARFVRMHADRA